MSNERKRLRLNRETLRHLSNDELSYAYGGQPAAFTLFNLCGGGGKPAPQPQPQPQPSGGSCVGFQCPPGTLQTMNFHCVPGPRPNPMNPVPFPILGTIMKA